jgi:V8-like Glu-specific endopeptidase
LALAVALGLSVAACSDLPVQGTTSSQDPIVGGMPDTTDSAVMALIDQLNATTATACSGTTIALSGASGIFLTAAHCVVANDGMGHVTTPIKVADPANLFVVPGPDWQSSVHNGLYYGVGQVAVHPQYDGSVDSPFDVALVRFLGAVPGQPVIPALTPTEDKLAVGTAITVVGFGKTLTNAMNSTRFMVDRQISSITANQFIYTQTDSKGACEGDSGGPALVSTSGGLRVAGITSFGDPNCTQEGASVRVSPVVTSFVQSFINCAPSRLSCNDCALASVGPSNACVTQSVACATAGTACGQFLGCVGGCTTQTCVSNCQRSNPSGANAYAAIVQCQCNACTSTCSTSAACGGSGMGAAAILPAMCTGSGTTGGGTGTASGAGGTTTVTGASGTTGNFACSDFTDPRPACQTCIQNSCCSQAAACASEATCSSCLTQASSPACRLDAAFIAMNNCLAMCSNAPCSSSGNGAGTSGTVPSGSAGTTGQTGGKSGCDVAPGPAAGAGLLALLALAFSVARGRAPARARAAARSSARR